MKKITETVLIFGITLLTATIQAQETGWDHYELKGKVKTYTVITYTATGAKDALQKGEEQARMTVTFNDSGYRVMERETSAQMVRETVFDGEGRKIETKVKRANAEIAYREILQYGNDGNMIEKTEYGDGGTLLFKTVYQYDGKGNKIEEQAFDSDNQPDIKTVFKYDDHGNCLEYTEIFPDGGFNKRSYTYDSQHNQTAAYRYGQDGEVTAKRVFSYDARNNLIEEGDEINKNYAGRYNVEKYKYDEQNHKTEHLKLKESGESYQKTLYSYDKAGRLVKEDWYDEMNQIDIEKEWEYGANDEIVRHKNHNHGVETEETLFTYDETGNVIQKVVITDDKPTSLTETKIEYFK